MIANLIREDFLEKVFDYEHHKEWRYQGDHPCVIDFYANWCAPCKFTGPVLEQLEKQYADRVIFYKVDSDAEEQLMKDLGIGNLPTFLLCPMDGQPVMAEGVVQKDKFESIIRNELLNGSD